MPSPESYDWHVQDGSGWIYLLPPLRGLRLLCIDPTGPVAHRLAAEGAEVTVIEVPRQAWRSGYLDPALRPSFAGLRFAQVRSVAQAWQGEERPYDGIVIHDLRAECLGSEDTPAMIELLGTVRRHLHPKAFIYLGALHRYSPWRLARTSQSDRDVPTPRGISRSQRRALVRAAGFGRAVEHPYVLSGADLLEVIGPLGYRSTKNRERRAERAKEWLLGPVLSRWLAPAYGSVGCADGAAASIVDALRERLRSLAGQAHADQPLVRQYFVLHGGKIVVNLGWPDGSGPDITVVLARNPVAVRRREFEATILAGLQSLPPRLAALVPRLLDRFEVAGAQAFVLSHCPGVTCDLAVPTLDRVTRNAFEFLVDLHRHTRDASAPAHAASQAIGFCAAAAQRVPALADCLVRLRAEMELHAPAMDFPRVCMHGDFKVENVMYVQASGRLTGVIDWELSIPQGLPLLDLLYLLTFNRMIRGQPWLDAFAAVCLADELDTGERDLVARYLQELDIAPAHYLPLSVAFLCHDLGCRIQEFHPDAGSRRRFEATVDELLRRLVLRRSPRTAIPTPGR